MADVGQSTTAHSSETSPLARVAKERLQNWGRWQRMLSYDGPRQFPDQPMFREMVERYRVSHAAEPFNVDQAEYTEAMLTEILTTREVWVCRLRFIACRPSRRAAETLSHLRWRCSHVTYLVWVDEVIDRVGDEIGRRIMHESIYGNSQSRQAAIEGRHLNRGRRG